MKILMLGNSFTTANRMPDMLAELTFPFISLQALHKEMDSDQQR